MRKARGSLTLVSIGLLLLISGTLTYQLAVFHSRLAVNRSLIQSYHNKSNQKLK